MPHVKRTRNPQRQRKLLIQLYAYPPDFLPGGLSNCRGARSHEHLDSFKRVAVAGRLTRVLGDGGGDANRTIYRWPVRLHGSGGAHTPSDGGKTLLYLSERWKVENSINNNDRQQQLNLLVV